MAYGQIQNRQGTALSRLITAVQGVVAGVLLCVSSVAHLYATFALHRAPDLPGDRVGVLALAALHGDRNRAVVEPARAVARVSRFDAVHRIRSVHGRARLPRG